ncbi:unnamed protein product, partial [marine sediment metagenome]
KRGHRVNDLRMDEVQELGPALLAVVCPFCLIMLDEAAAETFLALQDIAEVIAEALQPGSIPGS